MHFLAMVYVLALVYSMLKETGQISFEAAFSGVAIASAVATLIMAFWTNSLCKCASGNFGQISLAALFVLKSSMMLVFSKLFLPKSSQKPFYLATLSKAI